jgi:hypothetical protein
MRRTEALQGVRMTVFLNLLSRWESAELNQEAAACSRKGASSTDPTRQPRLISRVVGRLGHRLPGVEVLRELRNLRARQRKSARSERHVQRRLF